jgi:hypothetical protein
MRREKPCIAALLGHSGTHRTRVRFRSSFGRALHYTAFDDADEYQKAQPIRQGFTPARWGFAPDYIDIV